MDDRNYKIVERIHRYFADDLNDEEKQELDAWLKAHPAYHAMFEDIRSGRGLEERERVWHDSHKAEALRRFQKRMRRPRRLLLHRVMRYAAVIGVAMIVTLVWQWPRGATEPENVLPMAIVPGQVRATLTLEDGASVVLEAVREGKLNIMQSGVRVQNGANGIVYSDTSGKILQGRFNQLATPRGGEYNVTLSDGTKVFLNAASRLKYPVLFEKESRTVYLSGEAFFEVTRDDYRPFYVVTDALKIEVYGTSFNVNTRYESGVQAVLISGEIGVQGRDSERVYRVAPSELIEFTGDGKFVKQEKVSVLPYVAWRDGKFIFENESLEHIMSTLSLWYDVDVFYANDSLKGHRFTGHMKKYEQIDTILDAISRILGVTFAIHEKTITVAK